MIKQSVTALGISLLGTVNAEDKIFEMDINFQHKQDFKTQLQTHMESGDTFMAFDKAKDGSFERNLNRD